MRFGSAEIGQYIVIDPEQFGGKPHVRGTTRTVEEIQDVWRRPGVCAAEIREHFPDLSEAQLGAAVTWAPKPDIAQSYVAESDGPPRRKLYLWCERGAGWTIAVSEFDETGAEVLLRDTWAETREAILQYPEVFAPRDIVWRDQKTSEIVDVYSLRD